MMRHHSQQANDTKILNQLMTRPSKCLTITIKQYFTTQLNWRRKCK